MTPQRLSGEALSEALGQLHGWRKVEGQSAIAKDFAFDDFTSAFAFMTRVALLAEKLDHHPEWRNVYNRVHVMLLTHDADGVTDLDIEMAQYMNRISA